MADLKEFSYWMNTRIIFGIGCRAQLGREARLLGKKALLVAVKGAMRQLGVMDELAANLEKQGVAVAIFDEVRSNPSHELIQEGAAYAREQACDLVIALGGGSAIDAAKGIAIVMVHGDPIWDYLDGKTIPGPGAPLICLPTTAGTGSEVTPYAVFSNHAKVRKEGLVSPYLYPRLAIVDPELLTSCPPGLIAACGTDALAQAIESYITKPATHISEGYSLRAIRLCARYLRRAAANPTDLEAQYWMGLASLLGGMAIGTADTVIIHCLAEALGGFHDVPHGNVLGVLLAEGLRYNLPTCVQKYAEIAEAMGEDIRGLSLEQAAEKTVQAVDQLIGDLGLPRKLSEIGVSRESIPLIAKYAMRPGAMDSNSRVPTEMEVEQLLWSVY